MPKKKQWKAPTLNEVLADLNMAHEPAEVGARHVTHVGERLFTGTAGEVWHWLREEGHVNDKCRECGRDHTDVELDLEGVCEDCHASMRREEQDDSYQEWLDGMSRRDAAYYVNGENWRGE